MYRTSAIIIITITVVLIPVRALSIIQTLRSSSMITTIITTSIFCRINTALVHILTEAVGPGATIRTLRELIDLTCRIPIPRMSVKCAIGNSSICNRSNSNYRRVTGRNIQVPSNTSTWITRISYGERAKEFTRKIFARHIIRLSLTTRFITKIVRNLSLY